MSISKIIVADHYGFCMGVSRAIKIADEYASHDEPVTILKEIVHNDRVVDRFRRAGVRQAKTLSEIDTGIVIFSAHGVARENYLKAEKKGLTIVDATCPLVLRVHKIIRKLSEQGYRILHYGDPGHDETEGVVGQAPDSVTVIRSIEDLSNLTIIDGKYAMTSQTTALAEDFEKAAEEAVRLIPGIKIYNTVCNATSQRQKAVRKLAREADMVLVIGSTGSANSRRLAEIANSYNDNSHQINGADEILLEWFDGDKAGWTVGLTSGASTPDSLLDDVVEKLRSMSDREIEVVYPGSDRSKNRLNLPDEE